MNGTINITSLSALWAQDSQDIVFFKGVIKPANHVYTRQKLPQKDKNRSNLAHSDNEDGTYEAETLEGVQKESLEAAILLLNKYVQRIQNDTLFMLDESTGKITVKVLNVQTQEVSKLL